MNNASMTLILAAFKAELSSVYSRYAREKWQQKGSLFSAQGKIHTTSLLIAICDIGPVTAAMHTQYLVDHHSLQNIVLLGTAGALQKELALNDLIIPDHCTPCPSITTRQHPMPAGDPSLQERFREAATKLFPQKGIHAGNMMTSYHPLLKPAQHTQNAVDMEAWAVALIAQKEGIPLAVVKSITDLTPLTGEAGQSMKEGLREANTLWPPLLEMIFS